MDRLEVFDRCERLFKQGDLSQFDDPPWSRFLKLRSMNRSVYLKPFLEQHGLDVQQIKAKDLLSVAFCSTISDEKIEIFIKNSHERERKKRKGMENQIINELYKLRTFDWGGLYRNSLEKTIVDNYVKKITDYEEIEKAIENNLQKSLRGYVLCSWYNHWTSILIEDIFKDHPRTLPALGLIPKIDFFIDDCPYDLKVTYLPEGYVAHRRKEEGLGPELTLLKGYARKNSIPVDSNVGTARQLEGLWAKIEENCPHETITEELRSYRLEVTSKVEKSPEDLIEWLYKNQGLRRFDLSNKLFVVLVNTKNFFESWKMKRAIPLLRGKAKSFLNHTADVGRDISLSAGGGAHQVKSDLLVIRNH